jgi:hypothetical protein
MGLIPNRGRWEYESFNVLSTATFRQGSLVKLGAARTVSEYSGGEASFLGVALHNSANSLPAGRVLVAIPTDPACTVMADLTAGDAASGLSLGQTVGIVKSGNTVSVVTTVYTSSASRPFVVRSAIITSPTSQIELGMILSGQVYGSSTSQTIV